MKSKKSLADFARTGMMRWGEGLDGQLTLLPLAKPLLHRRPDEQQLRVPPAL
jgi:hypothetical protein